MNKIELLEEMYEMAVHNWICYSKNLSLNEAQKGYSKEWEESKERIVLVQEMIEEQRCKDKVKLVQNQISEIYNYKNNSSKVLNIKVNKQYGSKVIAHDKNKALIFDNSGNVQEFDASTLKLKVLGKYSGRENGILKRTANLLTVNDFTKLLSKDNIIALLVFSIIFGLAINITGEKAKPVVDFLESANEIINNVVKIIMYYAPIGLGCYFAALVGSFGEMIVVGYLKTFVIYTIVSILYYLIIYSIYAFVAGGKKGIRLYWKNVLPATATALGTCSSAASIPVNIECSKKIGVPEDVAETAIPLGTSFHKDGSIIGSVFKIMFLVCLFGMNVSTGTGILGILAIALVSTLLVTAVPIGGGTISEMLIITMLGCPTAALPILTIIATIIDAPATMLNVVGDTASSMMISKIVDGKNWLKK